MAKRSQRGVGITAWILIVGVCLTQVAYAQTPPTVRGPLRIVVIEGEGAVNIVQQKTAVAPVVEVRDRNDLPVAGILLTFSVSGRGASFAGGAQSITVATNAAGRATASGLMPTTSGAFRISASATFQGQTATVTITQSNVMTAGEASSVKTADGGSSTSGTATGKGPASGNTAPVRSGTATTAASNTGSEAGGKAPTGPASGKTVPDRSGSATTTPPNTGSEAVGGGDSSTKGPGSEGKGLSRTAIGLIAAAVGGIGAAVAVGGGTNDSGKSPATSSTSSTSTTTTAPTTSTPSPSPAPSPAPTPPPTPTPTPTPPTPTLTSGTYQGVFNGPLQHTYVTTAPPPFGTVTCNITKTISGALTTNVQIPSGNVVTGTFALLQDSGLGETVEVCSDGSSRPTSNAGLQTLSGSITGTTDNVRINHVFPYSLNAGEATGSGQVTLSFSGVLSSAGLTGTMSYQNESQIDHGGILNGKGLERGTFAVRPR